MTRAGLRPQAAAGNGVPLQQHDAVAFQREQRPRAIVPIVARDEHDADVARDVAQGAVALLPVHARHPQVEHDGAEVSTLVRTLDRLGYRGDYSFEVFNDDYTQLPHAVVAERARRSVKWLTDQVSRRSLPLRGAAR